MNEADDIVKEEEAFLRFLFFAIMNLLFISQEETVGVIQ